jgi:hypothetical protein
MTPDHTVGAKNRFDLVLAPSGTQEAPIAKAQVTLAPSDTDNLLWKDLDAMTDQVAAILAGGQPYERDVFRSRRGFIGLQNHLPKDVVSYCNIIVTPL